MGFRGMAEKQFLSGLQARSFANVEGSVPRQKRTTEPDSAQFTIRVDEIHISGCSFSSSYVSRMDHSSRGNLLGLRPMPVARQSLPRRWLG